LHQLEGALDHRLAEGASVGPGPWFMDNHCLQRTWVGFRG